jgi:hypothetical protein
MKTVDDIYLAIATNIASAVKEDWASAAVNFEVLDGMVGYDGSYVSGSGQEEQIDVEEFDFQLTLDLLELHGITTAGGNNRWNRAVFKLEPQGKFDMQFIWDQELHDEVEKLAGG